MRRKTITQLYAEFEKACAAIETSPYPRQGTGERKYNAAIDLANKLCRRIVMSPANPANPIPEMLLKIAAAGWGALGMPLDRWTSRKSDELSCLVSLREDLQRMLLGTPPRAARRTRRPARAAAAPPH